MEGKFASPGGNIQLFTLQAKVTNSNNTLNGKQADLVICNDRIELYVWNSDGTAALIKTLCVAS